MSFEVCEELHVRVKNEAGTLAGVLAAVAGSGVAVRAFYAWGEGERGTVALVPTDARKAKAALKKAGYAEVSSAKVVLGSLRDKTGMGAEVAGRAAARGYNLDYAYATGTGKGTGAVVLAAGKLAGRLARALSKG
nr:hypothetical protein [Planctomycetota bacterium]